MGKEIIVSNCQECPFVIKDDYDYIGCKLNHEIGEWIMPKDKVHDDCPLKKSSYRVSLYKETKPKCKHEYVMPEDTFELPYCKHCYKGA
jgi:hypothetical protein